MRLIVKMVTFQSFNEKFCRSLKVDISDNKPKEWKKNLLNIKTKVSST
jgi:hypothetical protein